jgi:hypothetical protein
LKSAHGVERFIRRFGAAVLSRRSLGATRARLRLDGFIGRFGTAILSRRSLGGTTRGCVSTFAFAARRFSATAGAAWRTGVTLRRFVVCCGSAGTAGAEASCCGAGSSGCGVAAACCGATGSCCGATATFAAVPAPAGALLAPAVARLPSAAGPLPPAAAAERFRLPELWLVSLPPAETR